MRNRTRVFGIGRGKTGTTSLAAALRGLGYVVGNQPEAESLIGDWAERDFSRIIKYCRTAEAFQDVPFSLPFTYQAVDAAFPGSKFILTVRNSADEWFDSLVRFHSMRFGGGDVPTEEDLAKFEYGEHSLLRFVHLIHGDGPLYDREVYTRRYEEHNETVQRYFEHRRRDLLVLNVADGHAYERMCAFLGLRSKSGVSFPHLNVSS